MLSFYDFTQSVNYDYHKQVSEVAVLMCSVKKRGFRRVGKFTGKKLVLDSLLNNKNAGWRPVSFLRRYSRSIFSFKFCEIFKRTPYLQNTCYWLLLKLKQNSEQIWSKFETKIKRIWIWSEFEMYLKRIESQKAKWSKFVKWCVNLSKSKRILYNLSEFCIQ